MSVEHRVSLPTFLILASSSPRRQQLLSSCGFLFEIIVPNIEELPRPDERPAQYVLRNSLEKALAVSKNVPSHGVILSADTVVVTKDGVLMEKPKTTTQAKEMLSSLSGRTHTVYTSYAILYKMQKIAHRRVETLVTFRNLSNKEIDSYVASGEPMDKAGAYGIQGTAAGFVHSIHGSYTNVMGLPLSHVIEDLQTHFQNLSSVTQ